MKYIIANWKMYLDYKQSMSLFKQIDAIKPQSKVKVVVCPSFPVLGKIQGEANHELGAQDVAFEDKGAYTSQVSAAMLKQLKTKYVILGHSERRQYLAETDVIVNKKLKQILAYKLTPIICVGETLADREQGKAELVVKTQLQSIFKNIKVNKVQPIIVAYEPIWAIGTGKAIEPADALTMHRLIKKFLDEKYNSKQTHVIYGGSVKPDNVGQFIGYPEIEGALIGGASTKFKDFKQIIKVASGF